DAAADPGAGEVGEVRLRLARRGGVRGPPEVDGADAPRPDDLERVVDASRDPHAARKVPPRAEGDDADLDLRTDACAAEAVDDLVHGPVAADNDERGRAVGDRVRRE